MKLRIRGNSIRLRLGQSEVRRLLVGGSVEESTAFGPSEQQRFGYSLCVSLDLPDVSASFADGRIIVRVPMTMVREWATTDQVSIDAIQPAGDDGQLRILIEKDFECIDAPRDESQEDAFPHPLLTGACAPANVIERPA
ncbi:MAG: hypothetical protein JWN24_1185 [Phycisphaerales bacterium]|nr:hypothetical protein [Phycisphaerales bacterium]